MGMSPYIVQLRSKVGTDLLVLPSVTVLIRNDRNEVLLARHRGFEKWGTIGGMVEPEEHPATAAVREVEEETGWQVTVTGPIRTVGGPQYSMTYPNGDRVTYVSSVYEGRIVGGAERLEAAELLAVGWFDVDRLDEVDLDPFATGLFRELEMLAD